MKTILAPLTLLALAALYGAVKGQVDHTYVSNRSSKWTLNATIVYDLVSGSSDFINRIIAPGTWQGDQYSDNDCDVAQGKDLLNVYLAIANDPCIYDAIVHCDTGVVGQDNADLSGVDIYLTVYGTINEPQGSPIVTVKSGSVC